MPRPKAFDEDAALDAALGVFWARGYEAASTADLVAAMGIGRQSLYDTFGDKHRLYLRALARYQERGAAAFAAALAGPDALEAIIGLIRRMARSPACDRKKGCMLVNAATERATTDQAVADLVQDHLALLHRAVRETLARAQAAGRIPAGRDLDARARLVVVALHGAAVLAKAGADPAAIDRAADELAAAMTA
ncbi:MAG: HTH-type transcriptional repressor ComR [Planctomycetota bacterium]|jgi:TetR/AcrR family transcriptional repressor of nem operon